EHRPTARRAGRFQTTSSGTSCPSVGGGGTSTAYRRERPGNAGPFLCRAGHRCTELAGRAFPGSPGMIEKVADCGGDFVAVCFERKVSGIEEAHIRVRHVSFERLRMCLKFRTAGRRKPSSTG